MRKLCRFVLLAAGVSLVGIVVSACPKLVVDGPYVCQNGTPVGGIAPRQSATRCSACDVGYRLEGEACAANVYACANGTAAEGRPAEDQTPRCTACGSGYRLIDEACVANRYFCANGEAKEVDGGAPVDFAAGCASCNAGYYLAERADGTICEANAYACANGTPAGGRSPTNGDTLCAQCDLGYHLDGDACAPNVYTCQNGVARSGRPEEDKDHNQEFCVSCTTANHSLHADSVTGSQTCGGDNYICFNGVATSGTATKGTRSCASCDPGYTLSDERSCVAHQYACPNGSAARGIPEVDKEVRCASCGESHRLEGTKCVPIIYEQVLGLAAIGNTLYMTGGRLKRLYTVDIATGQARAVAPTLEAGFGVGESEPKGLTAIGDTLYMAGSGQDRLYTLDTATGKATAVDPALEAGFGKVDEDDPRSLVAVGGTLYMAGIWGQLYVVDAATGVASYSAAFLMSLRDSPPRNYWVTEPRGLAAIGNTIYVVDGPYRLSAEGRNRLFIVDIVAGTALVKDVPGAWRDAGGRLGHGFNVGEYRPSGLAAIGDTLYMGSIDSRLYTLDPATGAATLVGRVEVLP